MRKNRKNARLSRAPSRKFDFLLVLSQEHNAVVTTEAEAHGHTAHGDYSGFTRLDGFADDSLRLRDEAELFQKSFCKFFYSHGDNIYKIVVSGWWLGFNYEL